MPDTDSSLQDETRPEPTPPKNRHALFWALGAALLLNLPYLMALFAIGHLPPVAQTLVVGAIVFIVPGLPWAARAPADGVVMLFRVVLISLAAALAAWLILLPWPGLTNRVGFILLLALVTNIGLWLHAGRLANVAAPFRSRAGAGILLVAALFFAQTYLGAAHFVPALEDQDMETQGTAYGLMHEAAPTMVTNRDTTYFFAHPLLLHFWIGESAFISDDLDRLRYHHDAARTLERGPALLAQWELNFERFESDPVLLPTRTPNIFLSVFTIIAMSFLVLRLTGSGVAAIGAALLYMTLPEIYVRSSYGGYLAITNFLLIVGAYFYLDAARLFPTRAGASPRKTVGPWGFTAAFLGGWADQKAVLLPMAAPVHAGLRILLDGKLSLKQGFAAMVARVWTSRDFINASMIVFGFVAGWLLFVVYGLAIAPDDFIADHIKGHIAARLRNPTDALQAAITQIDWYPSIAGLWLEFANHTGWLVSFLMVIAAAWTAPRIRDAEGFFLIWALIGAIGFSLVDWRQTKHLAHILPALVILVPLFWVRLGERLRLAVGAVVALAILLNAWRIIGVMQDFTTLQPTPIW